MNDTATVESLSDLRVEIDRIDAAMHELLIERGTIIDRVIAAKARAGGGSAFRPDREAAMMRRLAERHRGQLPLDTVESIWRVIIATFTFVQAPYAVHADGSGGDAAIRDTARFHFGFTVPLLTRADAAGVVDAVARSGLGAPSGGDLGLVRLDAGAGAGPWWRALIPKEAPKIIARLPFVERPDHPAGMPVFVLANPSAAMPARDVVIYALSVDRWRADLPSTIASLGGGVIAEAADDLGLALLVETPGALDPGALQRALLSRGGEVRLDEIGSHAARYDFQPARHGVNAAPTLLPGSQR